MASFAELLQEKVPVGGIILRQPPRDVPEKPVRLSSQNWHFECAGIDFRNPRSTLLCNGAYSVVMAETGQSCSAWNGIALTKTSFEPLGPDAGMSFYLNCGGDLMSLLPSPVFRQKCRYAAELTGAYCRNDAKSGSVSTSVTVSVPENEAGELRTVEIISSVSREAELVCYFEPVLSRLSDYESHPAFSKLSLETSVYDNSLIVKRRPRAKGRGIALAFDANCPFTFDTSREKALGRGGISSLRCALLRDASSSIGSVLDPCVLTRVKVHLEPEIPFRVSFALTTSSTPQAASAAAKRILSVIGQPAYSRLDETAHRLNLTPEQLESAMALLPGLLYPSPDRIIPDGLTASLKHGQTSLWSLGISGDLPILTVLVEDEDHIASSSEIIPMHQLLSENGVSFDLVYLLKGGGDYRSTLRDSLISILRTHGVEGRLSGRGGIHLADAASEGAETVRAVSSWTISAQERAPLSERSDHSQPVSHPFYCACAERELTYWYNDDNQLQL
jgi:cyclic beta-1,2-glucan synthetase